ncbi:MAG: hypothetical protein ABSC20_04460 [Candidatus Bathyarchaeia archaeon]|jgi:hypothetical protein
MDYQNEKSSMPLNKNFDRAKRGRLSQKLESISLRDVSLKDRRKEAKKPLFLIRYE